MTDVETLNETMDQEYAGIAMRMESLEVISPRSVVTSDPKGGYIVAFRHPPEITGPFDDFTLQLERAVPCIRYDAGNAHTTLAVIGEVPLARFQPDEGVLDRLRRAATAITMEVRRAAAIDFRAWLLTEDSVIVAGYPISHYFWEAAAQLVCAGNRENLRLGMPKLAHMTAIRFTAEQSGEAFAEFRERARKGRPLGVSQPMKIDVGWYRCSGDGFEFHDRPDK
jgi:hypothetical protein